MKENRNGKLAEVNCRIGSLEKPQMVEISHIDVNCRIGSLEMCFKSDLTSCLC